MHRDIKHRRISRPRWIYWAGDGVFKIRRTIYGTSIARLGRVIDDGVISDGCDDRTKGIVFGSIAFQSYMKLPVYARRQRIDRPSYSAPLWVAPSAETKLAP